MATRSPVVDAPPRSVRWDRDRFYYEQDHEREDNGREDRDREDREREREAQIVREAREALEARDREARFDDRRSNYSEIRERFVEADDHVRDGRRGSIPGGGVRERERSVDRFEQDRFRTRNGDDVVVREHEERRSFYDDENSPRSPRFTRRPPPMETEYDRKVVIEKESGRNAEPARLRRPGTVVRRQSSLDTFDRRRYQEEADYTTAISNAGASLSAFRRDGDEHRLPPYQPIPLPRHKALPPPRVYAEREYERDFDEISVIDPHRYGDEEFHPHAFAPPSVSLLPPGRERIHEREIIRSHERDRSRESKSRRRRSSSSSSSNSSVVRRTAKNEYPKKGKTRIPQRLVSKRALRDLNYPFVEEGNTIVIQKALGQDNIDDLLKISQDYKKSEFGQEYKKSEFGVITARPPPGEFYDRRTEMVEEQAEIVRVEPPWRPLPREQLLAPLIVPAAPAPPLEEVETTTTTTTIMRDLSPARSHRSHRSRSRHHRHSHSHSHSHSHRRHSRHRSRSVSSVRGPVIVEASPRDRGMSDEMAVGPLALLEAASPQREEVTRYYHHRHYYPRDSSRFGDRKSHSRSRSRHHRARSRSIADFDRDVVRTERLPTGELVLFEEHIEKIDEPRRGTRIEKDRKGRMAISMPKFR